MKKILLLLLILFTGNATASSLPNCPSDPSASWHNCFGSSPMGDNGDIYSGEWKNDKYHGQGTYTWGKDSENPGDTYIGEFKDGKRHGQGTYTHADGDKYVGNYKDDKKHGQGTYTYVSGSKYAGEFKDGNMHGQGAYTYYDGRVEKGYSLNNEYVPTICENMGLTKGTESFGQCVIRLIDKVNEDD